MSLNQLVEHPYLRDGWALKSTVILPDVNPADAVVRRMRNRMIGGTNGTVRGGMDGAAGETGETGAQGSSGGDGVSGPSGSSGVAALQSDVALLQGQVETLQTMVNGASISAECNLDGTITVTLTWGS